MIRKKMEDVLGTYCEVCDYYVHTMCLEFAVPNCLESATFDPASDSTSSTASSTAVMRAEQQRACPNMHHFQEGNLPNQSKCAKCRKACWSDVCLTGMRCQWCGLTAHSSCLSNLHNSQSLCQFGCLEPIFLPPGAVSIPRSKLTQQNAYAAKLGKDHPSSAYMQARKCVWTDRFVNVLTFRLLCSDSHKHF